MKGLRAAFEQLSFAKGDGIPSIFLYSLCLPANCQLPFLHTICWW